MNAAERRWDDAFMVEGPRREKRLLRLLIYWHDLRRHRLPLEFAILSAVSLTLFSLFGAWGVVVALLLFLGRELLLGLLIELLVVLILRKGGIR